MSVYPKATISKHNKEIKPSINFPELEKEVLEFWDKDSTFKKSLDKNRGNSNSSNAQNEFIFYDGPPFANGMPHYGHLLTGFVKDVVPRYKTMKGFLVDRVFGWDTHGLPAELEAERELGISGKDDILALGIEKFNDSCRKSVLKYTNEWEDYVRRQGRWVDFEGGYKTLDLTYMESTIWAFKQLFEKDLVYEGFKVLPYCVKDETPLSNHELRMDDDVYQNVQDTAVTCKMSVNEEVFGKKASILIWTTTPWTLPSNTLIAVGEDIDYSLIEINNEFLIIATSRIEGYKKELEGYKSIQEFKGKELIGKTYSPLLEYSTDFYKDTNALTIVNGDFVTTTDGTGAVHIAPYGEDDMVLIQNRGIKPFLPVDESGRFDETVEKYKGVLVFDSNKEIINELKESNKLFKAGSINHSYPHCWRCRTKLIYKPVSSWFVNVVKIKDRLLELNDRINWIPSNVKDGQFGKWLENARDWSISRNRFWGSPIPVWVSDNKKYPRVDVYGSLEELEKDFGVKVDNLHRPYIDELVRDNPDDPSGQSKMRRIEDVFDCWFESGSMSFCQKHYPFENTQWFDTHFPGNFIVEYIGQTRGWFYTMHIMSTALFNINAFEDVMCHGIILGDDGQKMSKSLRNYPDVSEVFERDGSDALRWFLMSSPILRGGNLKVSVEGIRESTRNVLLPLWSAYYFFTLYANASNDNKGIEATEIVAHRFDDMDRNDRYILSKLFYTIESVDSLMEKYDISSACSKIQEFIDVLNNWYIRTSRDRFWNEEKDAFDTLWTILFELSKLLAPLLPFLSEVIYQGLSEEGSVHLADFPTVPKWFKREDNSNLVSCVDLVRDIISSAHSIRKAKQLRVRLPLSTLTIIHNNDQIVDYEDIIKKELNVKTVEFMNIVQAKELGFDIEQEVKINPRNLGPKFGANVQTIIKAIKESNYKLINDTLQITANDGNTLTLDKEDFELIETLSTKAQNLYSAKIDSGYIALNTFVTRDLEDEGLVRDLIREIQETRKTQGLDVSDRIRLVLALDQDKARAVEKFEDLLKQETLTKHLELHIGEKSIAITKSN